MRIRVGIKNIDIDTDTQLVLVLILTLTRRRVSRGMYSIREKGGKIGTTGKTGKTGEEWDEGVVRKARVERFTIFMGGYDTYIH